MNQIPPEIRNFYNELEEITSFVSWDLEKQITPLSEMHPHEWNKILATEQLCFSFDLNDGNLTSGYFSVTKEGRERGIPSLDDLTDENIKYLISRINKVKNQLLISRYNHVLYELTKHRSYAINAIESYYQIVETEKEKKPHLKLLPSLQAILRLTEKAKFRVPATKSRIINFLHDEDIELIDKHYLISSLINSSLYKSYDLKFIPELTLKWLSEMQDLDYFTTKSFLVNVLRIRPNNKSKTAQLYEKLAENEDKLLEEHQDDSDFLKSTILGSKMEYYKKAKNLEKYEETRKEYTRVKSEIQLPLHQHQLDEKTNTIINEEINKNVSKIIKWDSDKILAYFSNHSLLFPNIDNVVKQATEDYNKSFLRHISNSVFDINVNAKTLSDDEMREKEISNYFQIMMGIETLPVFIRVLQVGAYNLKINYNKVNNYLLNHSWYGQNIQKMKMRTKVESQSYNWLNMMAPALHSYLIQLETSFLVGSREPFVNWTLPLDSLTLKFEGALRDFVRLVAGSTSIIKKNEIQEMLLEDLLASETAKKEFSKNDLALFKMVFTKKGLDIRNNIAHGFYKSENYTLEKMCNVFLCILRLGKYKLKPVSKNG